MEEEPTQIETDYGTIYLHRSKEKPSESFLKLQTQHDTALALCLAFTTFLIVPFLFLVFPYMFIIHEFVHTRTLSHKQETDFRKKFQIPKRTILRLVDDRDCQVLSVPFLDIIFLNKENLDDSYEDEESRAYILHELGHVGRWDIAALIWIIFSAYLWFFWEVYTFCIQ